ncbi:hypothetical protein BS78_05G285300 [Paspalum vaginatum]|nr:hypothetical protein BS78_05G285300 [Paspalum vaginatum]
MRMVSRRGTNCPIEPSTLNQQQVTQTRVVNKRGR